MPCGHPFFGVSAVFSVTNYYALFHFHPFGLQIGVIRRTHERATGGVGEAHCHRFFFHLVKLGRADVALHRQVVAARLQILAQRQHGDAVTAQIAHHFDDFRVGFAQADHQAGFGRDIRVRLFKALQQLQRPLVVGARAHLAVYARHVFQVVVKHVRRRGGEDLQRAVIRPRKSGTSVSILMFGLLARMAEMQSAKC